MKLDEIFFIKDYHVDIKHTALLLKTVNDIVKKDKGYSNKGILHKPEAKLNLSYAYFIINSKEYFNNYNEKELDKIIKKRIGAEESWTPYDLTFKLIKELKEDLVSIEEKLIDDISNVIYDFRDLAKAISENNRSINIALSSDKELTIQELAERQLILNQAMVDFSKIATITNGVGELLDNLQSQRDKLEVKKRMEGKQSNSLQDDRKLYERKK